MGTSTRKLLKSCISLFFAGLIGGHALSQSGINCCPQFSIRGRDYCELTDTLCFQQGGQGQGGIKPKIACKNSKETYVAIPNISGYNYQWIAIGGTVVSTSGNQVTVQWGSANNVSLTLIATDPFGNCKDSVTVNFCTVASPKADFTFQSTVCTNQPVTFVNTSVGGNLFYWNFGNGNTYVGANPPAQIYSTPGTYIVSLTATNNSNPQREDCYCKDIKYDTIKVINGTGVTIQALGCYGSICPKDSIILQYTTPLNCASYNWTVNGGTIIAGAGTQTITVLWNTSFSGTPTVSLSVPPSCAGGCASSATITVPIIYPSYSMSGPSVLCLGSGANYSIPTVPGLFYNWQISPPGGLSITGNSFNTPSVNLTSLPTSPAGTYTLTVNYYDSLKKCGGTSTKIIHLRSKFSITGKNKVCLNQSHIYTAVGPANWQVYKNNLLLPAFSINNAVTVNYTFTSAGLHMIVAQSVNPLNYCNSADTFYVNVIAPPVLTSSISSPIISCPGDLISLSVSSTKPDFPYVWSSTGGCSILSSDDNTATVSCNSSGTVSVIQQDPDPSFTCPSNVISFTIQLPSSPTISGPVSACADQIFTYNATPTGPFGYQWSVVNGTIMSGQGTSSVQIKWAGSSSGTGSVSVSNCAGSATINVTVANPAPATISASSVTCSTATLTYSLSGGSPYTWYHNGTIISGATNQSITANAPGIYACVPSNNICAASALFNLSFPAKPNLSISTPVNTFCAPNPTTIPPITFNSVINTGGSYSYQWYFNGNPIPGANGVSYTTPPSSNPLGN
ncbi:MAG: PKD domain-containing protein, partial [Chitinophagales bacterium]|nr:PKD domain-containing protein [Chitinophagales bacterium]